MVKTIIKTGGLILTMNKVTIMTTNTIIRYVKNLTAKNEITDFQSLGIMDDNIAAVSWEMLGVSRKNGSFPIIDEMIKRLTNYNANINIYTYIQLSSFQPNTSIIRYKKTWGLLEFRSYETVFLLDKKSFITSFSDGLLLSGTCKLPIVSLEKLD